MCVSFSIIDIEIMGKIWIGYEGETAVIRQRNLPSPLLILWLSSGRTSFLVGTAHWSIWEWMAIKSTSYSLIVLEKKFLVIICSFHVNLIIFQDKHPKKINSNHNIVHGSFLGMPNYFRRKYISILKFSFLLPLGFDSAFQMSVYHGKQCR